MRLLIISESPLECVAGEYYAFDPWIRFITHLAAVEERVVLLAPVADRSQPGPGTWRLEPGRLQIVRHDYYHSFVEFFRLWAIRQWRWRTLFARLFAEADIVALRLPSPSLGMVMSAAKRAGLPVALVVAGDTELQSDRILASRGLKRWIYRRIVAVFVRREIVAGRSAAVVFAYSSELAHRHRFANVRPMRTPQLRLEDFVERQDTCQEDSVELLRVSWLIPSKGLEPLLDAVAELRRRGRNVRLRCVGKERTPGYQASLMNRAARLQIDRHVTFSGWIPYDQMSSVFSGADIQVISSLAEGTPRCILDGLARGLPLVCTRVGGCGDYLEDGSTALLVPPGEPKAMADAIERLLLDHQLRQTLIAGGYALAKAATFEALAPAILGSLRQVARRGHGSSALLQSAEAQHDGDHPLSS